MRSLESAETDSACFFVEAGSKNPVCWRGGVEGEIDFFLIFLAKFKLIIGKFCGIASNMRFADIALLSFSVFKGLFCISCVTVYAKSNAIWTFKVKRLGLLVYPPTTY